MKFEQMVGSGLEFIGDLVGADAAKESSREAADAQRAISAENTAMQREFAKMGIQWRVEDAKAAGLHPMFALGAQLPMFSPNAMSVMEDRSGEMVGKAVSGAGRSFSESYYREKALEVQAAAAQKDIAQAGYFDALAAKERQGRVGQPPVPDSVVTQGSITLPGWESSSPLSRQLQEESGKWERTEIKAAPTFSRDSQENAALAGSRPMWQAWQIRSDSSGKSMMMDIPWSDEGPMESLREMPVWMMPEFVRHNMQRYGGDWLVEFLKAYPDSSLSSWLQGKLPDVKKFGFKGDKEFNE